MKPNKFSLKKWNENRIEHLSFFGFNRFNDWIIVLLLTALFMVCAGVCGYLIFKDVESKVEGMVELSPKNYIEEANKIEGKIDSILRPEPVISTTTSRLYIDPGR